AGRQQHRFDLRLPSEDVDDEGPDSGQQRGHEGQACEPLGCRVLRDPGIAPCRHERGRPAEQAGIAPGGLLAHRAPRPIQRATARSVTIPTAPARKPSATGPTSATGSPPGCGGWWSSSTYAAMSSSCCGSNANAGIGPGPTMIASPTVRGSARSSGGAMNPPPTVPPAPVAPWHAAQLATYSCRPRARSPFEATTFGIAGPGPSEATNASIASICSSLYAGDWRTAGAPGADRGMRPVRNWKSAAAAPTPTSEGPYALPSPEGP